MIVVSEGAAPKEGKQLRHETASGEHRRRRRRHRRRRGGPAHRQRSPHLCAGTPSARRRAYHLDRILGTRFGISAVHLITEKKFGTMVSYQNYLTLDVPIRMP